MERFEDIFDFIDMPVFTCANCLCNYCSRNVESDIQTDTKEYCFNCDECSEYTDAGKRLMKKHECNNFLISPKGIEKKRKQIRQIK